MRLEALNDLSFSAFAWWGRWQLKPYMLNDELFSVLSDCGAFAVPLNMPNDGPFSQVFDVSRVMGPNSTLAWGLSIDDLGSAS